MTKAEAAEAAERGVWPRGRTHSHDVSLAHTVLNSTIQKCVKIVVVLLSTMFQFGRVRVFKGGPSHFFPRLIYR